jgi:Ser/Thr protein kinase RdoA (MazF antagonist)
VIGAGAPGRGSADSSPVGRVAANLSALVTHVADAYVLGEPVSWTVLTTGYEDLNIDLTTTRARYVVKAFATGRTPEIAARTAGLIEAARAAGVRHPPLRSNSSGDFVYRHWDASTGAAHQVLVMDFVPGRSLYDLRRAPTREELVDVLEHSVRIHRIDAHPPFVLDPWAVGNLASLSQELVGVLDTEQRRHVEIALTEFASIDHAVLPAALIHGDLTKGNVLIPEPRPIDAAGRAGPSDAGVVIVDFAVANRLPRVQDLAVIAANLCHGAPEPLPQRGYTIGSLYSAAAEAAGNAPLSGTEWTALHAFTRAAGAMELLGALAEWRAGNHGAETAYLIDLGLTGLRSYGTA